VLQAGSFVVFILRFHFSFYSAGLLDLQAKQSVHAGMTDMNTEIQTVMKTEMRTDS
jgi:hypothetical protein